MYDVPVERASSLDDIQRADHICIERILIWHHAIVESVDKLNGEVNIIEYTNTTRDFIQDNFRHPKNPGKAVVVRGKIKFDTNKHIYVIKHTRCFDPETVVSRAKSRLKEREYNAYTNNCEHFALWCKTGISSSNQINKATDALKVVGTRCAKKLAQKEIVKTVVSREVAQELVSYVTYSNGKHFASTGVRTLSKKVVTQATEKINQEVVKTGVGVTKQIVVETTVKVGKEATKTGMTAVTKQAASNSGKEMVITGFRSAPKEVFTQSVTTTGQEVVTTGVRSTTRKVVTNTVTKTGKEVLKTGTRKTTKEVVTKTTSQVRQESTTAGLQCAIALEGISAVYDISCAYKAKQEGKISQSEFNNAVANRVVTGTMNVAGSSIGAAIGQVVIPIPVVGGLVGGIAGSFLGKYVGGLPFRQ